MTRHPTAEWLAQQIAEAFPWDTTPRYLIRDNDCAYGKAFTNRVRAMGIRDRPIAPRSPWQNPYVERLIGTLRCDCLDHVLILGERHLRRVLTLYSLYYNETRTHLGLAKDAPLQRAVQRSGTVVATGTETLGDQHTGPSATTGVAATGAQASAATGVIGTDPHAAERAERNQILNGMLQGSGIGNSSETDFSRTTCLPFGANFFRCLVGSGL